MTLQGDADIPNWPTICFVDLAIHEGGRVTLNIWGESVLNIFGYVFIVLIISSFF